MKEEADNDVVNNFNMEKVYAFLGKLFKESDKVSIINMGTSLNIKLTSHNGRKITKANVAVNIKDRSVLGWYDEELDLCLIPVRDGGFTLNNGCCSNKPIRPLLATFID